MRANGQTVVVTGLGAVTPIGTGVDTFWKGLLSGRGGYADVRAFDVSGQRTKIGCEVEGFEETLSRAAPLGGRAARMALAAAAEALHQARIFPADDPDSVIGICLGTTMGEIRILEEFIEKESGRPDSSCLPASFSGYPCSSIPLNLAATLGLRGPNLMVPNACAAGNYAIGLGHDLLLRHEADVMLVGGVDPYSRVAHTGFNRLLAVSPDVCRPFDARRQGIIPGEGAGMLVLETRAHAWKRGAECLAEVLGYGFSNDAFHITNPEPSGKGLVRAMERAFKASGIRPDDIDYISAHGTGTRANDASETKAIKQFFGRTAYEIPVSSIKSMIGHTMGAASALEAVACVQGIRTGWIPPTTNYGEQDPECDLDYVPNEGRRHAADRILSISMAFGGNNSCLLMGRG